MYPSIQIANYFIKKGQEEGIEVSPMKIIKMCYIAHGWHLGIYEEPLIGETVYAWKYGPVIQEVYDNFKSYGSQNITKMYYSDTEDKYPLPDDEKKGFLDFVWDSYKKFTAVQLSTMTHQSDTPWYIVWFNQEGKNDFNVAIPNNLIQKHYEELFVKYNKQNDK